MAFSPAFTCWTAWLPVMAPRAGTYESVCRRSQSRSAPCRARVCSMWRDPRRRSTSCTLYGLVIPAQRGLDFQSIAIFELLPFPLLPIVLFSFRRSDIWPTLLAHIFGDSGAQTASGQTEPFYRADKGLLSE